MRDPIYTVGHSIQAAEAFVKLLRAHAIEQVADVRLIPQSARHPHFARERLTPLLESNGISYRHFRDLGGRRKPHPDSINTAWRVDAFRGYADYMGTEPFRHGFDALLQFAAVARTTVMCAEAVWWQCHRRLLSDALLVHGVPVLHIMRGAAAKPHEFNEFAREHEGGVIYPGLL